MMEGTVIGKEKKRERKQGFNLGLAICDFLGLDARNVTALDLQLTPTHILGHATIIKQLDGHPYKTEGGEVATEIIPISLRQK